jgi:subtilisin family serine protease
MATETTYTYRAGKKVPLEKPDNQFVTRLLPRQITELGATDGEQVSSASTKVTVPPEQLETLMQQARRLAPTHHAYYLQGTDDEFLITDRVFVSFKKAPTDAEFDAFSGRYALLPLAQYSDTDYLFQLTDHTGMNPVKLVVRLTEKEPEVAYADHDLNQRPTVSEITLPTDPTYARQWHLHDVTPPPADFDPRATTHCDEAWQLLGNFGSADVVVGLSDDGCKLDHPDFNSAGKFAAWGYLRGSRLIANTDIDAQPAQMYKPGANHGTSCAGVIAAETDGVLTVGAAPGCRLLPIQWESSGPSLFISDSKLLTVLQFIQDKVDVFSNSWGGVPVSTWSLPVVNRLRQLATSGGRRGKGILFLWAAGNENCPINYAANVDVPYDIGWAPRGGSWVWVGVRTARRFENNLVGIPGLLHVAALASTAQRSHYSNYGPGIALCAPSSNSHAYFRMRVRGLGVSTATGDGSGITNEFGGTSSATPLVAGIAALVISAWPELTALEVVSILQKTAAKDLNLTPYAKTPPASYDPNPSWDVSPIPPFDKGDFTNTGSPDGTWSPWFGHGRVDAPAAVHEALARRLNASGNVRLRIVSALVNPVGSDRNRETVTLRNLSLQPVSLTGWRLAGSTGKGQTLSGVLNAGQTSAVSLKSSQLRLANNGGTIRLLDGQGNEVHKVTYGIATEGQVVTF